MRWLGHRRGQIDMDGGETIFKQKYDESNQAVSNDQILYRTPPTNVTVYSGITTERKIWEFEQLSVDSNPFDVARSLCNVPPPLGRIIRSF